MLFVPLLLILNLPQTAESAVEDPEFGPQAIQAAVGVLVSNQESYVADRPVGFVKDLDAWTTKERERLQEMRGGAEAREWPYEGVYRVGRGQIPSGYRVGGTGIVCTALLQAGGYGEASVQPALDRALEFLLEHLDEEPTMAAGPKRGYDVRGWGHAFALEALLDFAAEPDLPASQRERVDERIESLLGAIEVNEVRDGGWNYANDSSANPFQTGSTLLTLFEAEAAGHAVDGELVERALAALEAGRAEKTGAFAYSGTGVEPMHASAARAAVAELALERAGRSTPEDLERAVAGFFDGWEELLVRKSQQGTHEGPYNIAPYYFFFGHQYAGIAIEHLPEAARAERRGKLHGLLERTRNERGGWNDRIFPRTESVNTAMVLQALLAPQTGPRARWSGANESR